MATIRIDIVSVEGAIYSGEARMVFAPARMGEVGIAPRHAPLLTTLNPGEVRIALDDGTEENFYITGGMLEVQPQHVMVLADSAVRSDQLDEGAALAAKQAAEKAFDDTTDEDDRERAHTVLVEAEARYRVIQKLKGRRA